MAQNLELELQRIGLNEREAKVYLAALELGPSPVQKIAQRAGIPRATVYLILDDLRNKGFVTTYDEGKKTFFVAESPERLSGLLDEKEAQLQVQKEAIKKLVPELMSRGQFEKTDRPIVRFYEGAEALKTLIRDNLSHAVKGETIGMLCHDRTEKLLLKAGISWDYLVSRRKQAKISRRLIYTWKDQQPEAKRVAHNAVYIPYKEFPCNADIAISGDRVSIVPYDEPIRGVVIEDNAIADNVRLIFDLLWSAYKKRQ